MQVDRKCKLTGRGRFIIASCKFSMPDDFLMRLSRLGDRTDEITEKVLEAGGQVALAAVRDSLNSVLSGDSSGELAASLGLSPVKLNRDGTAMDIKVGFSEPRSDGKSNAMVANVLEYGKHGQPPRPFLKPAKSKSKSAVVNAMKQKFEEELNSL